MSNYSQQSRSRDGEGRAAHDDGGLGEKDHREIILARHGKPNLQHWAWITPRQMKDWIQSYNQADLLVEDVPLETLKKATESGVIVSSTLRRCVQSAQQLTQHRELLTEEIFCEADLPHSHWSFPRLPLSVWGIVFRLAWFCGFSANAEPFAQATTRARNAAERLIGLSRENGSVFHVGHGIMTMLIARQLLALGWTGPKRPLNKYWQYSVYHASA
jgi:broad specificity phosphatase PhoE